jgi:hypothetical protein
MSSIEALGQFVWICGAPQSMKHVENRFCISTYTCTKKFNEVLLSVNKLAADIIKPKDLEFGTIHQRLQSPRFSPFFDKCIGAIYGTQGSYTHGSSNNRDNSTHWKTWLHKSKCVGRL